ncbi:MAG: glycoside hydrolase family 15 protein [Planctomycetota bacterium]
MPRDIPVGNGSLLVCFDDHYRIRDLYYPHVGQENHVGGSVCRFGVWGEHPKAAPPKPAKASKSDPKAGSDGDDNGHAPGDRRKRRLHWTDDGWRIERRYQPQTLATDVTLEHDELMLRLTCTDVVDFQQPVLVRRIDVENLHDEPRQVRLFHHHDFAMYGFKVGDTVYYDPQLRSLIHYRQARYIIGCFYLDGDQQIDEYATGNAGFHGAEGTWRDAEDGALGNNPIAQGAVDSTMMCKVDLPANGHRTVYLVLGFGQQYRDCEQLHGFLHREGPQGVIDRTVSYWRLWLTGTRADLAGRPPAGLSTKAMDLLTRSLLVVRTQIDNQGAITAANDSDYLQFSRDTYSYLWPRDGAFVADAMDAAGFPDVARQFFHFCAGIISDGGYFLHKYNPDGTLASSWHPWIANGHPSLPIQEDETALILWAMWRHFERYRDIEFIRPLYTKLIRPAADFLYRFRDPATRLPLPSYDLWEERFGVHAFTVASVYAGLQAGEQFARAFGDDRLAQRYGRAARETRDAFNRCMWCSKLKRYVRRVEFADAERIARLVEDVRQGREPIDDQASIFASLSPTRAATPAQRSGPRSDAADKLVNDEVIDASMYAIFALGMLPVDNPRVDATMRAVDAELRVKTKVGGVARYTDDYYHQVVGDDDNVPGNPWFICTLWLAEWHIARAISADELAPAAEILDWVADRALLSGVLAEQVNPLNNDPMSVSPLTWSHATVVGTLARYMDRLAELRGEAAPSVHDAKPQRKNASASA